MASMSPVITDVERWIFVVVCFAVGFDIGFVGVEDVYASEKFGGCYDEQ